MSLIRTVALTSFPSVLDAQRDVPHYTSSRLRARLHDRPIAINFTSVPTDLRTIEPSIAVGRACAPL